MDAMIKALVTIAETDLMDLEVGDSILLEVEHNRIAINNSHGLQSQKITPSAMDSIVSNRLEPLTIVSFIVTLIGVVIQLIDQYENETQLCKRISKTSTYRKTTRYTDGSVTEEEWSETTEEETCVAKPSETEPSEGTGSGVGPINPVD